jgi:hypothetical protein
MDWVAASKVSRGAFEYRVMSGVPIIPRNLAQLPVAAAILLQCAGCLVGPDFKEPSAPVAEKWLEAGSVSVDTRNQEYRDWWKVFRDPVLDRLIETAYNQNLTLVSAGTQVLEARAQLGVAIGEFYPQVQQGNGSVTYIRPSHADTTEFPSGVTRNFWRDALGLTANWELDFWGKFRPAVIPHFDCHRTPCPVAMGLHGVPRHVRERADCLFLDGFNGGEFETLLVEGNFIFLAHVKIVA